MSITVAIGRLERPGEGTVRTSSGDLERTGIIKEQA
jgi:hypothetical protein